MGRLIAYLAFFLLAIAVCWGLFLVAQHFATRRRQKLMAKFAPELLEHENLPKAVTVAYIQQRKQLDDAGDIMQQLVNDPYFNLTTQYHTLITRWLKGQQKESTK